VVASAALLTGCVLGHNQQTDEPVELRCRAIMSLNTRAQAFDKSFPVDADLGVWAFALPREKEWEIFQPDAETLAANIRMEHNEALWVPQTPLVWDYDKQLTLIAYSPFEVQASYSPLHGIVFDIYDTEESPNTPLLYTDFVADQKVELNCAGVTLPFYHALSKVDVKIKTVLTNDNAVVVKKIYLEQIHTEGTFFSHPTPEWVTTSGRRDVTLYEDEGGWSLPAKNDTAMEESARLVMPQSGATRLVVVADVLRAGMYYPNQEFVTDQIKIFWEPGKYYTYSLVIAHDSLWHEEPTPEDHR
jgi:hypothetical protein